MSRVALADAYRKIESLVQSGCSVAEGMAQVIEHCARERPHPDWARLRAQEWEAESSQLKHWLTHVLRTEPPPATITGWWFGLFNPVRDGEPSTDLYVAGNPYDAEDGDWPCGPRWFPEGRYAHSKVLADIHALAYAGTNPESGLGNDAEYPLCLAYAALSVRTLAQRLDSKLLLGEAKERFLVVGFDSGDSMVIGRLCADGLRPA
ncbi:hypothetical protein ACN28E_02515 [Archangium lansingense]|uniref:hypothetical protein n=1 Tax=Archangium lansingense TaxID=2995310 RepID=UPI003B7F8C54